MKTFGSLFDGIGAFSLGLQRAGWELRWSVEIEPDCRRVTAKHFPGVQQQTDVRQCGKRNIESVDLLVGGFPCQGLSVAGLRSGLSDPRSGLFYEMVRIVDELRPRFLVWENVPGLLSSDHGRDFARVLRALADIGYFGAVRCLDGQHFGVPQRRRRLFGVFAGVGPRNRRRLAGEASRQEGRRLARLCAEILFVREGSAGHSAPGSAARPDVAGTLGGGTAGCGWSDDLDRAGAFVPEQAATLRGRNAVGDGVNPPGRGGEDDQNLIVPETAFCLTTSHGQAWNSNYVIGDSPLAADLRHNTLGDTTIPVQANGHGACPSGTPHVIYQANGAGSFRTGSVSLSAGDDNGSNQVVTHTFTGQASKSAGQTGLVVRRLTPTERLRLQSLPDDWLDVEPPLSDSAKYRMIGNAGVVNVLEWIGRRLVSVHKVFIRKGGK